MASTSRSTARPPKSPESFESLNRRNAAAEILQSYEKLSWYSFQRCESLAQTRLHFQSIIAGLTEEDEAALIDWKEDRTPRPRAGEEDKDTKKGKERTSTGSAGGGGGDGVAGSSTQKASKTREKSAGSAGGSAKKKRRSGG